MNHKTLNQSVCIPSDNPTIDEYGNEEYDCIVPTEIIINTDTQNIKDNLFYAAGRMDAILSTIVEQITKNKRIGVIFAIKDGGKSMTMNISNDKLNKNEIIALGMVEIGIGIIFLIPSGITWAVAGLLISSLIAYFLSDLYLYLKDKSIELWEKIKTEFDSTTASIASLIEKNVSSLRDFTSNIINKVSSWVDEFDVNNLIIQGNHSSGEIEYNPAHPYANPQRNLSSKDYQSLIELLLNKNSNALDIDTLLHTFPNYLAYPTHSYSTKDSINSSLALSTPKDALPIHIKAQCFNHKKEALSNREIYVYSPNFYSFVDRAKSDENGFIEFHNAYVSSKMTNSDLYFVLNRYGLDEEQKDFHIKISPSKTIQPKDKQVGELLEQRLSFEKNIPKAITLNDNIKPNIKVNAIEYIPQEYNHNSFNSPLEHHLIESITLQAHYVLKDSHKKNIQGDEQSLLKESIQRYKHKTKWGYIVFDRDEEIEQTLKQVNKTQPLIYSKRFKELENIKGEIVNIPFKEEWESKQIRFFAYLWRANRDVGWDYEYTIEKLRMELHLIEAEAANFARQFIKDANIRQSYKQGIKEMSNKFLQEVEKENDKSRRNILAERLAREANIFRNQTMNDMRKKSTHLGKSIAEVMKKDGRTFDEMVEKKIKDLKYNKPFEQLTSKEQMEVYKEIIKSSGKDNKKVSSITTGFKYFGRFLVIVSFGAFAYDIYLAENKAKATISGGAVFGGGLLGGSAGGAVGYAVCPFTGWFFVGCIMGMSGVGAYFGAEVGDFIVNDYFSKEVDSFLKEHNLD